MRIVAPLASVLVLLWAWMAEAQIAVARVAAQTSTGNQTLTAPGVSWTPVAAILFASYASVDGTAAAHAGFMAGFTDCTRAVVTTSRSQDATAPTSTVIRTNTGRPFELIQPANTNLVGAASFVSCGPGGLTLNWTTAPSTAYFVHLVLFGAATVANAYAGAWTTAGTIGNSVDITAPGFQPHDVLVGITRTATNATTASEKRGCFGVGSPTAQGSIGFQELNNLATTANVGGTSNTYACQTASAGAFQTQSAQELGAFDAQGFSATTRTAAGGYLATYLALRYQAAVQSWQGVVSTPTTPGALVSTAPGFPPAFVLLLQSQAATINVGEAAALSGSTGVALLTPTAQYTMTRTSEDGITTPNTQSLSDDQAVNLPGETGATVWLGTLTEMTATGFTLDFSATSGTAAQWYAWAVSGTSPFPPLVRRRHVRWW